MASSVLLAALCIPRNTGSGNSELLAAEGQIEKNLRMSTLLGFSTTPTRDSLIADLASKNIVSVARPELRTVYSIMEQDFLPLDMMPTLKPVTDYLGTAETLQIYIDPLRKVAVSRMLMQLSQVYKVMQISELKKLTAPVPFPDVEMLIVEGMRAGILSVRIDHLSGCVNFDRQAFGTESVTQMLTGLSERLMGTMKLLQPKDAQEQKNRAQIAVCEEILRNVPMEQKRILMRKKVIEDRKEEEEQLSAEAEAEAERTRAEQQKRRLEKERTRVENEAKQRAKEVMAEAEKEDELRSKKAMIDELIRSDPKIAAELEAMDEDEINRLDIKEVTRKRDKAANAEREAAEKKLAQMQRRLDHFERAKRLQEIPCFEEMYEQQKTEDLAFWKKSREQTLKEHRENYERDLAEKSRLLRLKTHQEAYVAEFEQSVQEKYEEYKSVTEKRIADKKAALKAANEEEARRKDEEEQRLMNEVRAAQDEAQRREEAERQQRGREEEQMQMQRGGGQDSRFGGGGGGDGAYRPGGMRGGGMDRGGGGGMQRGGGEGAYRPGSMRGGGGGGGGNSRQAEEQMAAERAEMREYMQQQEEIKKGVLRRAGVELRVLVKTVQALEFETANANAVAAAAYSNAPSAGKPKPEGRASPADKSPGPKPRATSPRPAAGGRPPKAPGRGRGR